MRTSISRTVTFILGGALIIGGSGLPLKAQDPHQVGMWAPTGGTDNAAMRTGAATATLDDGRTLIAGGLDSYNLATETVVIYDPVNDVCQSVGPLAAARVNASAALLEDGRVLVTGGDVSGVISDTAEIFDPVTGAWSLVTTETATQTGTVSVPATMARARARHASARLADGTVLIVGGANTDGALATAELFHPATSTFSLVADSMAAARAGASATILIDGRVLVAGGNDGTQDLASAEIYYSYGGTFSNVDTPLTVARAGHTALLLPHNNGVLIAGGTAAGSAVATTDLFLPATFPDPYSWSMGTFAATDAMDHARSQAVGGPAGDNGYAFVVGGGSPQGEAYRFATIKTDKDDYAPGEPAVITGSGWRPLEQVKLVFQEDPAVHLDYELTLTADEDGNIFHDRWAPERHDLNVRFYLMATGLQSQLRAQMTFTDAELVTSELTPAVNDVTVAQGSSANFTISLSATGLISTVFTTAPAKAKVNTSYALNGSGALTSGSPSPDFEFFSSVFSPLSCVAGNCPVTWTGAPTPYSVSATISADALTPVGTYWITLSPGAGTTSITYPPAVPPFLAKLVDGTATSITVHVVAGANTAPTADPKAVGTNEDIPAAITLSGSDTGTCDLAFSIVSGPTHGVLGSISSNACAAGSPNTDTANVTYTPTGNYNGPDSFTYKANDGSLDSTAATVNVTVNAVNDAPSDLTLSLSALAIDENGSTSLSGSFADVEAGDSHTVEINWGDGSTTTSLSLGTGILTIPPTAHNYLDDDPTATASDSYTITVKVTDNGKSGSPLVGEFKSTSASGSVAVSNVAPVSGVVTATSGLIAAGASSTVKLNFTDVGARDMHTCSFTWDGAAGTSPITVAEASGSGYCQATQVFLVAGVYTVKVTLTDDDTGTAGPVAEALVVVYDPSAGFVTGGGWINSPAGAYAAAPTLVGKANFGFVSKYKKGASTPTGETEFQFKTGDLSFHGATYQWLVVSGAKAQFKGTGSINGVAGYSFLLTATDGQLAGGGGVDKFRIKIWDTLTGVIVYDNNVGGSDDLDVSNPQAISGGAIVIHN